MEGTMAVPDPKLKAFKDAGRPVESKASDTRTWTKHVLICVESIIIQGSLLRTAQCSNEKEKNEFFYKLKII